MTGEDNRQGCTRRGAAGKKGEERMWSQIYNEAGSTGERRQGSEGTTEGREDKKM